MPSGLFQARLSQESLSHALVEVEGLGVEAVHGHDPLKPQRRIEVKEQGQVGPKPAGGDCVQFAQHGQVQASAVALIDDGRVRIPVAQDDLVDGQRGPDKGLDVVRPVCKEEEHFGQRFELFAMKKELSDLCAYRSFARLASGCNLMAESFQPNGQTLHQSGFAGSFGAFERDEHTDRILWSAATRRRFYRSVIATIPVVVTDEQLSQALSNILSPDRVLSGSAARRAYDCDAYSIDRFPPTAVVLPENTDEVQKVVRWCVANEVPFTARGAGTGLSGGALPALGGVVVSTKKMNRILKVDVENRCLLAQAGVPNIKITRAVEADGLHFAPDPSSQTVSTLGGNIAENSGGPHTLKYGVTTQHILALKMVDPLGEILELGSLVPGAPGFDFVGLVVGGEGTLGIVTEAWVKLMPLPAAVKTALASFPSVRGATQAVADIIASGVIPAALEMMDRGILKAIQAAFGLTYPEGSEALLLIECDAPMVCGDLAPHSIVEQEMNAVREICLKNGALDVVIAENEAERQRLWLARKKGIGAMGRLAPSIVTHDGVIPRSKLPEMLDFVYAVAQKYGIGVANLFHAGDGNLHPCFYFDDRDPAQVEAVIEAGEEIIRRCIELGGSISGEHGIGVEKLDLMSLMFSEDDLKLQAMAKRIFNDGNLCNPCKVLPNQKSCVEHKKRWRGVAW